LIYSEYKDTQLSTRWQSLVALTFR